jgi:hypothetical protein
MQVPTTARPASHQGTAAANSLRTPLATPGKEEAVVESLVPDLARTRTPPSASPSAASVAGVATVEAAR